MPGPIAKDPTVRQRRNKASTHDVLDPEGGKRVKAPPLNQELLGGRGVKVHPLTRRWWSVIWRSPMAPRWLESDWEGLYLIAILRNQFYGNPTTTLASEIRQQERRFGLDIGSRRAFDWRIEGTPKPAEQPRARDIETPIDDVDPRAILRAVK